MVLVERGKLALPWVVSGAAAVSLAGLAGLSPGTLDSSVFGPVGALCLGLGALLVNGGALSLGLGALWDLDTLGALPPVPSAAPLHVFGLLGAGLLDLSTDQGFASSPALSLAALLLGGLWSRRLGPHREVWSWDVVEITAVDLLSSELAADHFWLKRPAPVGVAWGGGEVRLFRSGLAASHHHLSSTGFEGCSPTLWHQCRSAAAPTWCLTAAYYCGHRPALGALRSKPSQGGFRYGAPVAAGEASLVAWALALLAPSSGAISAWGLWGAPAYLWLLVLPPFFYLGLFARSPRRPLWGHYPLVPIAHVFAAPLPWAPYPLMNRFTFRVVLCLTS